jgi:hypothetical protein
VTVLGEVAPHGLQIGEQPCAEADLDVGLGRSVVVDRLEGSDVWESGNDVIRRAVIGMVCSFYYNRVFVSFLNTTITLVD